MSTSNLPRPAVDETALLHHGDRMSQAEFHRRYENCPPEERWELIEGTVFMSSPLRRSHGRPHLWLATLFGTYEFSTPGVEALDNTTVILADDAEPQPDLLLRVLPEAGGRSETLPDDYISGPPELVLEVSNASRDFDLHAKRRIYTQAGILEYLVLLIREKQFVALDLAKDVEIPPGADGVFRSRVFPGLWIDAAAVLARDTARAMAALQQGLATAEHQAFSASLAARLPKPRGNEPA